VAGEVLDRVLALPKWMRSGWSMDNCARSYCLLEVPIDVVYPDHYPVTLLLAGRLCDMGLNGNYGALSECELHTQNRP
jgi:hypothetical protein